MAQNIGHHSVDYPMSKALAQMTLSVRITGRRIAAVRLWCAVRLIGLAAIIAGCNLEVDAKR